MGYPQGEAKNLSCYTPRLSENTAHAQGLLAAKLLIKLKKYTLSTERGIPYYYYYSVIRVLK